MLAASGQSVKYTHPPGEDAAAKVARLLAAGGLDVQVSAELRGWDPLRAAAPCAAPCADRA